MGKYLHDLQGSFLKQDTKRKGKGKKHWTET